MKLTIEITSEQYNRICWLIHEGKVPVSGSVERAIVDAAMITCKRVAADRGIPEKNR